MKTINAETMLALLGEVYDSAMNNYRKDKDAGADATSRAFDAGRLDGIQWCIEVIEREAGL
jgi:hypothetical protein